MSSTFKHSDPGFLVGKNQSKSFKEVLATSDTSIDFPELKVTTLRGLLALWISKGKVLHLAKPFEYALVGKFPLRQPVIKLTPYLDLSEESSIVLVWLSFPELHPHLFSPHILFGLGSIFGRPIHTDNAITVGSHCSEARILVEMDISKSHPDLVWLGPENLGYIQKVVVEGMPNFCSHCKEVGHRNSVCPKLHSQLGKVVVSFQLNAGSGPIYLVVVNEREKNNVGENGEIGIGTDLNVLSSTAIIVVDPQPDTSPAPVVLALKGFHVSPHNVGVCDVVDPPGGLVSHPSDFVVTVPIGDTRSVAMAHVNIDDANVKLDVNSFEVCLRATSSPSSNAAVGGDVVNAIDGEFFVPCGLVIGEPSLGGLDVPVNDPSNGFDDVSLVHSPNAAVSPDNEIQKVFDMLILIIAKDVLNTHLMLTMKDSCLDQSDCLVGSAFSPCGGVGDVLGDSMDDYYDLYSLNVGRLNQKDFSRGSGKMRGSKSKKY
ncbi:hypothetical protein M5K25_007218 [Dendrobium thyrsiflorum]|uniref:DUF4283 domain-containing protein n=1 Tax=Dendrobium thyrsiflorum TaxID=117978 RepID=A0ABD0VKY9_DENTH